MGNLEGSQNFPNLKKRIGAASSAACCDPKPAVISMPSPNSTERANGPHDIECIVLHHTARGSIQSAPFVGRYFQNPQVKASVHYIVGPAGEIVQSVSDSRRALHAGPSAYRGRQNVNDFSIGVEVMASADRRYSEKQYSALIGLLSYLLKTYRISADRVVSYREVALAKSPDASATFDWKRLREGLEGQAVPKAVASKPAEGLKLGDLGPMVIELQENLVSLGYLKADAISGYFGDSVEIALKLFQSDVGLEADGIHSAPVKAAMLEVIASLDSIEEVATAAPSRPKVQGTAQLASGRCDARTKPLPNTYKVRMGDTLAEIAKRFLGSSSRWQEIFLLNRNQLSNPDRIYPGMVLRLA